jgi:hypothetical protein
MFVLILPFLVIEGVLLWHVATALRRGRIRLLDKRHVERSANPLGYWGGVILLLAGGAGLALLAWESGGWRLGIVFACARDMNLCP